MNSTEVYHLRHLLGVCDKLNGYIDYITIHPIGYKFGKQSYNLDIEIHSDELESLSHIRMRFFLAPLDEKCEHDNSKLSDEQNEKIDFYFNRKNYFRGCDFFTAENELEYLLIAETITSFLNDQYRKIQVKTYKSNGKLIDFNYSWKRKALNNHLSVYKRNIKKQFISKIIDKAKRYNYYHSWDKEPKTLNGSLKLFTQYAEKSYSSIINFIERCDYQYTRYVLGKANYGTKLTPKEFNDNRNLINAYKRLDKAYSFTKSRNKYIEI